MKEYYAERVGTMAGGELGDLMRLVGRDDIISFAGGIPSPDIFPLEELKEIVSELLANEPRQVFQYSSTEGRNDLKDYIVEFLSRRELKPAGKSSSSPAGPNKLWINRQGFSGPRRPGAGGKPAMSADWRLAYQARVTGIDMEEDGISIDCLEETVKKIVSEGRR